MRRTKKDCSRQVRALKGEEVTRPSLILRRGMKRFTVSFFKAEVEEDERQPVES